ncbi:MAG: PAS domain-containing protein [Halioglobus sp.]|nr:PAS domain-containing protein [Halioglobus sp.]
MRCPALFPPPTLLQSTDDVAIVVDRDQRVLYSSAPADTPGIGQGIAEWLNSNAHEGLREHIETILEGGPVSVLEAPLDSRERQCQIRLNPLGTTENILAVALWCRDISDSRAERAMRGDDLQRLRASEQRFRTLIERT